MGEVVEKTPADLYKDYSDAIMTDKQQFVTEHQKLIEDGYVLVGYHGTDEPAALSIMSNGFRPSEFPDTSYWQGVYVANNLKLAVEGYAQSIEYRLTGNEKKRYERARVLAVYANKKDIQDIGITYDDINNQFAIGQPGYELNQKDSNTIISGKDTGFGLNELVIKKNIGLKAAVLPIITKDDFESVIDFFKLQEFAQKIIKDITRPAVLEDITTAKDPNPRGRASYNKKAVKKSHKLRDIEDVQAINGIITLQELPENALTDARKLFKLQNLSNTGFKGIKNYFSEARLSLSDLSRSALSLQEFIEDFKVIMQLSYTQGLPAVYKMKTFLSHDMNPNDDAKFILAYTEKMERDIEAIKFNKLTIISEFPSEEDVAINNMKKLLSLNDLTRDDFKAVINYFMANENSLLNAIEDFKAIQNVIKLKNLSDNALTDARELLKTQTLSNDVFKGIKNYLLDQQQDLTYSVELVKMIRALSDTKGLTVDADNMKKLLSLEDFNKNDFNKVIKDISNNLKIPLEHPILNYDLKDDQGGPRISYYCATRLKQHPVKALSK